MTGVQTCALPIYLHASTLVVLGERDPVAQTLSFVAAWALWSSIGVSCAELKWPNDIVVGGRKLAGILLERNGSLVVAGFGVNIAHAPALIDQPTTCLNEWAIDDGGVEPLDIFTLLQARFEESLGKWRTEGFGLIRRLWESEGPSRGDLLRVDLQNGMYVQGAYDGLADDGALRLLLASGRAELVYAGDVSMIEEY